MTTDKIKVLIVDDELIVRQGLRATVPWEKYGMEVVADASNGVKGWEAFQAHQPEVLITDIVMPKLNGLELAQRVKQAAKDTQVLLLSCHEDFAFAQQGIRLGASGYILKTAMDEQEMEDYLQQFQQELRKISDERPASVIDAKERHAQIGLWLGGFTSDIEALAERWFQSDWAWMGEGCLVYLIREDAEDEKDAKDEGAGGIDWIKMEHAAGSCFERIPCGSGRTIVICQPELSEIVEIELKAAKSQKPKLFWLQAGPIYSVQAWMDTVAKLYDEDVFRQKYHLWNEKWPDAIVKAIRLITADSPAIGSVTELADRVGLSRSHFSTLFKKVVGENIIDFQSKVKLHKAEHMLLKTTMSVSEISDQLGMDDANYFSKWFKRYTGISPTQYRANRKVEV